MLIPFYFLQRVRLLEKVYTSVEDIDLFIGMTLETPDNGSITGNTFRCLIGDQFARLKWGDRFFYDLQNQPGSFNNGKIHFYFWIGIWLNQIQLCSQ